MQTTLLGLAIAMILALVTALVAPLVVDWNHYRGAFEDEVSRLSGLSVHVGSIDARLLPSPIIKLHDVEIGGAAARRSSAPACSRSKSGLARCSAARCRPRKRISSRRKSVCGSTAPAQSSCRRLAPVPPRRAFHLASQRRGRRIVFTDANSGAQAVLQQLSFDGDIRSLAGPFSGEGALLLMASFMAIAFPAAKPTITAASRSGSASTRKIVR